MEVISSGCREDLLEGLRSEGKIMGNREARTEEGRAGGQSEVGGRQRGLMH